jgi:uncharacterized repeat protein (TIGR01451 family)
MRQSSSSRALPTSAKLFLAAIAAVGILLAMAAFSGHALSRSSSSPRLDTRILSASQPLTESLRVNVPQFGTDDRKVGPAYANTGDTIVYNIYVHNTGPALNNVTLRDVMPGGTTFIPASCSYTLNSDPPQLCGPLTQLWNLNLGAGAYVTTTYSALVTGGTLSWPLVNCAYLNWDGSQLQMCATTILNGQLSFLPFVMRGSAPPEAYAILRAEPLALEVGNTSVLTATAFDPGGVPITGLPVDFTTIDPLGSGDLLQYRSNTDANGQITATLRSTTDGPVRVVARGSNGSSDSIFVNFYPNPATACAPHLVALLETGPSPRQVALDLVRRRAYIAHYEGFTVLDMDTFQTIAEVPTPNPVHGIAYDHERNRIWVTQDSNRVFVYHGSTYALRDNVPSGNGPFSIAFNPTNDRVYVSNWSGNTVGAYQSGNPPAWTQLGVFREPAYMAVNPVTNRTYVANHRNDGHVRMIDGTSQDVTTILTGLIDPYGAAVDTTRNLIYASSIHQGRICVIDGATNTQVGCMDVQHTSDGSTAPLRVIEVNPQYDHLFAVTSSADGEPSRFLLIPAASTIPVTTTMPTPVPMYMRNYPMDGIVLDPVDDRVWVTNVASGLVSVVQDGPVVCSTPFPRGLGAEYELQINSFTIPHGFEP